MQINEKTKISKPLSQADEANYANLAEFCNNSNGKYTIKEFENYYGVVEVAPYVPSVEEQIAELKQYLADTDYIYIRKEETGEEPPEDIVAKRIEARDKINELEQEVSVGHEGE